MGQMGFFDLGNRYSGLDAKNEPLLKIDGVVPWEDLRARLEAVWRRADKVRKSRAGPAAWRNRVTGVWLRLVACNGWQPERHCARQGSPGGCD